MPAPRNPAITHYSDRDKTEIIVGAIILQARRLNPTREALLAALKRVEEHVERGELELSAEEKRRAG